MKFENECALPLLGVLDHLASAGALPAAAVAGNFRQRGGCYPQPAPEPISGCRARQVIAGQVILAVESGSVQTAPVAFSMVRAWKRRKPSPMSLKNQRPKSSTNRTLVAADYAVLLSALGFLLRPGRVERLLKIAEGQGVLVPEDLA